MAKSPSLPDPIESELLRLLDGPDEEFWPGVARLCQQNPALVKQIQREAERMQVDAQGKRAGSTPTRAEANDADADLRSGDRVGPFAVLDVIGHGGMGSVYLAEQREPVRRRVALKVIKLGMDTKAVLARFEAERQALAMMDHSHIAKVLEAGVTPKGKPYFAMEYVKGVPITRYCDDAKLSLEDRLALFKQVCSGVQHAHTKGVIHRDLTPNNVLVTLQDGKPAAKIIDFGLARATDHKLTEKTLFTEQGVILGTPEYMSPEQAGLNALDIDMRSDVYTLGVLLYELLTGTLPFEGKALRAAGYDAMCKTIREADPPRPSTKVTTIIGGADAAAKLRRTDVGTLMRRLRGDLDWIVLKCLEKDRSRRYETVGHLADDVQRHLECEPVLARAPSLGYRLTKLARRYRGQLAATIAVFLALVGGLGVAGYFWYAERAQATEAKKQTAIADNERRESRRQEGLAQEQARAAERARVGEAAKAVEAEANAARAQEAAQRAEEQRARADAQAAEAKRNAELLVIKATELENARRAEAARAKDLVESEANARQLAESASREERKARELLQRMQCLSAADLIDKALVAEKRLSPYSPLEVEAMRRWLDEDVVRLRAVRADIVATLGDLRRSALSNNPDDGLDRASHPDFPKWQRLSAKLLSLQKAHRVRTGSLELVLPHPTLEDLDATPAHLNDEAWSIVNLDDDKRAWGDDPRALMLARLACDKTSGFDPGKRAYVFRDTLAWACFANGRDAEAHEHSAMALDMAPDERKAEYRAYLEQLDRRIAAARDEAHIEMLRALQDEVTALWLAVGEHRTHRFDSEQQQFVHDKLASLVVRIDSMEHIEVPWVARHLVRADRASTLISRHPNAPHRWQQARDAIAAADGIVASVLYKACPLDLVPQTGLIPIGMNPVTKLWEFYDLRSAWDPASRVGAADIQIPRHDREGGIKVSGSTGIVLVLLPGGEQIMGSQASDRNGPNYDEHAGSSEGIVGGKLGPFFVSRFELTVGQWARLASDTVPIARAVVEGGASYSAPDRPMVRLSWDDCKLLLAQNGLDLPTEAQWEFACRAGTQTPWICAPQQLTSYANLADATARRIHPEWRCEVWDDRHVFAAPVGSFRPNAFGLHDVHGNVWEWTADGLGGQMAQPRSGDGLRVSAANNGHRIARGGGFHSSARFARSATRDWWPPAERHECLGVRPIRIVQF